VLGYDPATQRKQLSKHVGTVFGQRPQLWYHLPAIETLHLLARIYGVPSHEWKRRLEELTQRLELEPLLRIPVRKLSLGQRMRCEIAASLLHGPRILFLDEPTIGLDVVAKQQIRTFIKQLNKTEGTTVFLTSHDPSDIEALAQRAVVINGGKLVFDGSTHEFVRGFIKKKTIEVVFAKEIQKPNIPVGNLVLWENCRAKVELENANHQIGALLGYLAANFEIQDINIYDPEMEEIIRSIYAQTTQTL
jgi:ABC-2 type transport system ATP-binding protein